MSAPGTGKALLLFTMRVMLAVDVCCIPRTLASPLVINSCMWPLVANLQRVGPGTYQHHVVPQQTPDALADRGLPDPQRPGDLSVWLPAVNLQLDYDLRINCVQMVRIRFTIVLIAPWCQSKNRL